MAESSRVKHGCRPRLGARHLCVGDRPGPTRAVSVPISSLSGQSAGFRTHPLWLQAPAYRGPVSFWAVGLHVSWELRGWPLLLHFQAPTLVSLLLCSSPQITSQLSLHSAWAVLSRWGNHSPSPGPACWPGCEMKRGNVLSRCMEVEGIRPSSW